MDSPIELVGVIIEVSIYIGTIYLAYTVTGSVILALVLGILAGIVLSIIAAMFFGIIAAIHESIFE